MSKCRVRGRVRRACQGVSGVWFDEQSKKTGTITTTGTTTGTTTTTTTTTTAQTCPRPLPLLNQKPHFSSL